MPLPITNEIELLEQQIARLAEAFKNLNGISEGDKDIVRDTLRQIREKTEQLKNLKKLRWKTRVRVGVRGAGYAALAYLLVAAIADRNVEKPKIKGGNGPCDSFEKRSSIKVSDWSYGPNAAYKNAYNKALQACKAKKMICSDERCPDCKYELVIQNWDWSTTIFTYSVEIEAYCQCWCMGE